LKDNQKLFFAITTPNWFLNVGEIYKNIFSKLLAMTRHIFIRFFIGFNLKEKKLNSRRNSIFNSYANLIRGTNHLDKKMFYLKLIDATEQ